MAMNIVVNWESGQPTAGNHAAYYLIVGRSGSTYLVMGDSHEFFRCQRWSGPYTLEVMTLQPEPLAIPGWQTPSVTSHSYSSPPTIYQFWAVSIFTPSGRQVWRVTADTRDEAVHLFNALAEAHIKQMKAKA